jgi:hypothetical protein
MGFDSTFIRRHRRTGHSALCIDLSEMPVLRFVLPEITASSCGCRFSLQ